MTIDATSFRHALGHFASGVTVVTMAHDGHLSGLTVSAFASLSLQPPLILACIDKSSTTLGLVRGTKSFGVNILAEDQQHLSNHFASKMADKFSNVDHSLGSLGSPLLIDVHAAMQCRLVEELDKGDHIILIGEVTEANVDESKKPLLYYKGSYGQFNKS